MNLTKLHITLILLALGVSDHVHTQLARLRDDEAGLTTTELAVLTFLLVGGAIVVTGIIYTAARSNAENIPVPEAPAP